MFSHAPTDYTCPFCGLLAGEDDKYSTQQDIFYRTDLVTAFVAPRWWGGNEGAVLVIPNQHYENIYTIPDEVIAEIGRVSKKVALAMRHTYDVQGVSTRQHNEPVGNQEVWHFHMHVLPRTDGDNLYVKNDDHRFATADERAPYAAKLRNYLQTKDKDPS